MKNRGAFLAEAADVITEYRDSIFEGCSLADGSVPEIRDRELISYHNGIIARLRLISMDLRDED